MVTTAVRLPAVVGAVERVIVNSEAVAVVTVFRVEAGMKAVSAFRSTTTLPAPSIKQNPNADPCSPGVCAASFNAVCTGA